MISLLSYEVIFGVVLKMLLPQLVGYMSWNKCSNLTEDCVIIAHGSDLIGIIDFSQFHYNTKSSPVLYLSGIVYKSIRQQ